MLGLFSSVPSVCPLIRSSERFWANRLLLFSEILPKVAPQYLVVHPRFSIFQKISITRFLQILAIFLFFFEHSRKTLHYFFLKFLHKLLYDNWIPAAIANSLLKIIFMVKIAILSPKNVKISSGLSTTKPMGVY